MNRFKFLFIVFVLTASGCAPHSPSFSIQMTTPEVSKYIWPVGAPLTLVATGVEDTAGEATNIVFYANGGSVGTATVSRFAAPADTSRVTGHAVWTPTTTGEYHVQAELDRASGASVMSSAADVCVIDLGHLTPSSAFFLWGNGYTGPCTIPSSPSVPSGTSTAVAIHATADPVNLAYTSDSCSSLTAPSITFNATVNDPSGQAAFVTVRLASTSSSSSPYSDSIFLSQTGSGSTGVRTFTGSYGDGVIDVNLYHTFGGQPGTLSWEARAIDRSGVIIAHDDHTMLVGPCEPPG